MSAKLPLTSCRFVLSLLALMAFAPGMANAQAIHDAGAWFSINTQGGLGWQCAKHAKFKWWFDGHLRFSDDADGYNQSIVRPGIGYKIGENATLWAGYGWINESPVSGAPNFDENRIWQQLTWSKEVGKAKFSSRSRLEQRFVETGSDTGWRFRQFVKLLRPFECQPQLSAIVWDEMFFDLNTTDWGQNGSFSQNRVFAGLGWTFDTEHKPRMEIGYFQQYLRRRSGTDRYTHILALNWFVNF